MLCDAHDSGGANTVTLLKNRGVAGGGGGGDGAPCTQAVINDAMSNCRNILGRNLLLHSEIRFSRAFGC